MTTPRLLSLLVLGMTATIGAVAAESEGQDRALLTLEGRVIAVERVGGAGEPAWVETLIERGGGAAVRLRIAPVEVLDAADFRVEPGQTLQARVFSDEEPFGAQRVRNRSTGRSLQLRCLHGEPLWNPSEPSRGLSPGGPRRGAPGGARHRGGR